jgi:hypothetical protein
VRACMFMLASASDVCVCRCVSRRKDEELVEGRLCIRLGNWAGFEGRASSFGRMGDMA